MKNLLSFFGLCFCTGPDHTGKCACQRGEEYNPPEEWLQKDRLYWYNQGYVDAFMEMNEGKNDG